MAITPQSTSTTKLRLALWIAAALVLVVAVFPLPYGYYTFTRIVTCIICGILAYVSFSATPTWGVGLAGIAVLFNPVIPIYLRRPTWFWIDLAKLAVVAVIITHLVFVRGLKR
jgi:hypothetical protein